MFSRVGPNCKSVPIRREGRGRTAAGNSGLLREGGRAAVGSGGLLREAALPGAREGRAMGFAPEVGCARLPHQNQTLVREPPADLQAGEVEARG